HPAAEEYAAFRAKNERERQSWVHWPAHSRAGKLVAGDFDESIKNYHLYVQWLCAEQVAALHDHAHTKSTALYLDFPLGVNRDGFDVWRNRELFALDLNGGAPPDGLFVKGQNWGFPPLKPEAIRRQGYRYYIDCLRHHLQCADMLRMDHVMGWHRAYWVPNGMSATDGLYVRYQAREFHAILNLESQRHRVQIVGENLGTVPSYVNDALARHKILTMHVAQFGVHTDPKHALDEVPVPVVASLNTHDTATFMGFWQELDIDDHVDLGLQDEKQAEDERRYRAAQRVALGDYLQQCGWLAEDHSPQLVLPAWLKFLAAGGDEFLLINLEDLWLEPAPQNVPGTWQERPNWQRKSRYSLEALSALTSVKDLLQTISDIRRRMG
ncbi:MAG TPA: 4-alpha-glucanotransferase, partial [Candidatus Binatus sp.]|nr:4-alpha-glucanotransferase [Candidatus Binatus sp.]